jgi:site-specific DNA recombinase
MKKAVCYYRKSIENEAEKSLESQREAVHEYATTQGIEIMGEYQDVASSATLDRPGFKEMFYKRIPAENPDYILVYSFDRITREMDDLGLILAQLKKYMGVKTRLHSVTEVNDYDDDHYKLFLIMMKTFGATDERVRIVNRLQGARRRKADKGGFIGGSVPIGYHSIKGSGELHRNEEGVPIVIMTFELRKQGLTMKDIADALNEQGFLTRKKRPFQPMTVHRIIKNEDLYRGKQQAPQIL